MLYLLDCTSWETLGILQTCRDTSLMQNYIYLEIYAFNTAYNSTNESMQNEKKHFPQCYTNITNASLLNIFMKKSVTIWSDIMFCCLLSRYMIITTFFSDYLFPHQFIVSHIFKLSDLHKLSLYLATRISSILTLK